MPFIYVANIMSTRRVEIDRLELPVSSGHRRTVAVGASIGGVLPGSYRIHDDTFPIGEKSYQTNNKDGKPVRIILDIREHPDAISRLLRNQKEYSEEVKHVAALAMLGEASRS